MSRLERCRVFDSSLCVRFGLVRDSGVAGDRPERTFMGTIVTVWFTRWSRHPAIYTGVYLYTGGECSPATPRSAVISFAPPLFWTSRVCLPRRVKTDVGIQMMPQRHVPGVNFARISEL